MGIFSRKGVHPLYSKHTSGSLPLRITDVQSVTIAVRQHIGAPCKPTVKVSDEVKVGQVIAESEAFMSAPIHASISGKVSKIAPLLLASGETAEAITITSDGKMELSDEIKPPVCRSKEDFINAIRASGLVGLGGAGFPAHVKLNVPDGKVDTLIINAAECEPYITADEAECLEHTEDIIDGTLTVCKFLNIPAAVIGIEMNKPSAISALGVALKNTAETGGINLKIQPLKTVYPQGAEKVLIKSVTGREVPTGGLPSDVGCIVMNVASVAFVSRYMRTGKPLVSRTLTVDGGAVSEPKNLRVPIGTRVADVLKYAGGLKEEPGKILFGGPMMGIALSDSENYYISKNNNAILAFNQMEAEPKKETACIRCGRCVRACPMGLMPVTLENAQRRGDTDALQKYCVMSCIECGCCSFTCPAGRNLVQSMKLGKSELRKAQEKKKKEAEKNG